MEKADLETAAAIVNTDKILGDLERDLHNEQLQAAIIALGHETLKQTREVMEDEEVRKAVFLITLSTLSGIFGAIVRRAFQ